MHQNQGLIVAGCSMLGLAVAAACWISEPSQLDNEHNLSGFQGEFAIPAEAVGSAADRIVPAPVVSGSVDDNSARTLKASEQDNQQPLMQLISAGSESFPSAPGELFRTSVAESALSLLTVEDVRALIDVQFPEAEQELRAVWAESLAGMSGADVAEILEHRKRTGASLAMISAGTSSFLQPDFEIFPEAAGPSAVAASTADLRALLITNLRNAWTPGFRASIPLTDAVSGNSGEFVHVHGVIRNFSAGRTIPSPDPLHVAIRDSGAGMFLMSDGRLTRRGNFCVLADRTLGLELAEGPLSIQSSPQITVPLHQVSIDRHGQILIRDSAGETVAGQISVVLPSDVAGLRSEDGVLFTIPDSTQITTVAVDRAELSLWTIEISNVDVGEYEQRLRWQTGNVTDSGETGRD